MNLKHPLGCAGLCFGTISLSDPPSHPQKVWESLCTGRLYTAGSAHRLSFRQCAIAGPMHGVCQELWSLGKSWAQKFEPTPMSITVSFLRIAIGRGICSLCCSRQLIFEPSMEPSICQAQLIASMQQRNTMQKKHLLAFTRARTPEDMDQVIPNDQMVQEVLLPMMGRPDTICLTYGLIQECKLLSIGFNFLLLKGLGENTAPTYSHASLNVC